MKFERIRRHRIAGLFTLRERVRFKSTPDVPTPASPQTVSTAQTGSNVDTAVANATLGNVNTYSPFGSTTYNQTGSVDVNGNQVPQYSQTTSLNPTLQSILSGTQNTASSLVPTGQALADEFSGSLNGPNNNIIMNGPQALNQQGTDAAYKAQSTFLDPQWQLSGQQLQDQLSRQGIPVGSEAYNSAMTNFNNSKTQAYGAAANTAVGQGAGIANNMFNLALQGQEAPLNQLKSLYGATG